ncbi:hypothetical protein [Psychroflexus sp. ALD_RP9]|uniref:hypothetical protein n=1 Tax=Psychroflexus sp. ALD_RP9 TaxID=2777186 RepID=UPI001A8EEFDC|nr:hypothetical protein [Psychroflexus sp. ALD_RP9]QSS97679.1 hypothetical protein IMZ30_02925 [Psychroflexus sp. ALD_RP9]
MQTYFFPNSVKPLGWLIFSIGIIGGFVVLSNDLEPDFFDVKLLSFYTSDVLNSENNEFFKWTPQNMLNDLMGIFVIVGGILVAFSKEKIEDEFITQLRLSSLVWAVYVNYAILILAFIFVHGLDFFTVMVYNMFTLLIIFIARFQLKLKFSSNGR